MSPDGVVGFSRALVKRIYLVRVTSRDTRLQDEHAPRTAGHPLYRYRRALEMVQRPVAVDDVHLNCLRGRGIKIQLANVEVWIATTQDCEVLPLGLRDDYSTISIQEEAGVIAYPGANLEHGPTCEWKTERSKVLLPTLIVSYVVGRPEDVGWLH
jgi:hypothetical protein